MLHLITGANGAGKTLNTLKWVRERSLKENRPVCHNGRFEAIEGGELSSWKKIEFKDWQKEPDGTIFLIDECHNDLGVRSASAAVPDEVKMLAEHRRRGMDFYLITQHPQNVDNFVRRLIGSPGWHRHLKRTFGVDMVSCLQWDAVNSNCEKSGSGKSGTVSMVAFPKEVYGWYRSASLHTGKKKIPRAVWVLGACVLLVPALGYFAFTGVYKNATKHADPAAVAAGAQGSTARSVEVNRVMTVAEYVGSRTPRVSGFPHTAPAYDQVAQPVEAPYPAACIEMRGECRCYTQQATVMFVPDDICLQIVRRGFFVDFKLQQRSAPVQAVADRPARVEPVQHSPQPVQVVVAPVQQQDPGVGYLQSLAARNAQVRSSLQ